MAPCFVLQGQLSHFGQFSNLGFQHGGTLLQTFDIGSIGQRFLISVDVEVYGIHDIVTQEGI